MSLAATRMTRDAPAALTAGSMITPPHRGRPEPVRALLPLVCVLALGAAAPAFGQQPGGGDGTIYMGTYAESIYVIDEATLEVTGQIEMDTGIPIDITRSADGERLYVRDATMQYVEVVDVASGRVVDSFTLSHRNTHFRFRGMAIDPQERFVVLNGRAYAKELDRWDVGPHVILRVDLDTHEVTDTIPWPDGEEREFVRLIFSPDGELLYFFADDIIALETEGFTEVDRWELSRPLEFGMGRFRFGFPQSPHAEEGVFTGLFRTDDPVQGRSMMGVARVSLAERDVEFYTLGPSESVEFQLAPGGQRAYGLLEEIGRYEFWTFDLENRRIESRVPFPGRPRMALMPSSNGDLLYVYAAGNTIDVYDANGHELLRTVEYDADMTEWLLVPGGP